jgi:putative addiction module component (TIGR02574 family)
MSNDLLAEILKLSPSERIQLVDHIWASLSSTESPVSEEEIRELQQRVARTEANPERGIPWDAIKRELLAHK